LVWNGGNWLVEIDLLCQLRRELVHQGNEASLGHQQAGACQAHVHFYAFVVAGFEGLLAARTEHDHTPGSENAT
jgi:hypothetical protein